MIEEARRNVREVSAAEAKDLIDAEPDALVLDVRELNEWDLGHIPGAVLVPLGQITARADPSSPDAEQDLVAHKDSLVIAQCATGKRSLVAADVLKKMGYGNVVSMKGGIMSWAREGLPID
jgi:rhodanese-related sulfurtransferase